MTIIKQELKVNLGCGPTGIDGWENFDWGWLPLMNKVGVIKLVVEAGLLDKFYLVNWPKFRLFDIRRKLPFENNSVDAIYCSHVLEHFEAEDGLKISREAFRILKIGGIFRVILPDISKIAKVFKTGEEQNEAWWGYNKTLLKGIKRWFIRGHQWMYDVESAKEMLNKAGFKKIVETGFAAGECPNIERLDLAGYKNISLYLEAHKI